MNLHSIRNNLSTTSDSQFPNLCSTKVGFDENQNKNTDSIPPRKSCNNVDLTKTNIITIRTGDSENHNYR